MVKAERFEWATVVQLFSFVRIDMVHHYADVFQCQVIDAAFIRKLPAYHIMIDRYSHFLIWTACVTVKHIVQGPAYLSSLY